MEKNTTKAEDRSGTIEKAKDAIGHTIGAVGQFVSDRVLSPIGAGASRLAPVADKAKSCATRTAQSGKNTALKVGGTAKDLALKAGGVAKDVFAQGMAAGHRTVRKVPGVARAEDAVSSAVNGLPDRLNLVRADDIANLKQSVDALNRQIDRLVKNASA